jgi:predicted enzyme related to lactoylglutathione lyase
MAKSPNSINTTTARTAATGTLRSYLAYMRVTSRVPSQTAGTRLSPGPGPGPEATFGWTFTDAGPDYSLVRPVDGGLGGGLMKAPDDTPPYVTVYVQVEDLDVALKHIVGLGGTPLVPPTQINETASFAMFQDPDGNIIGLLKATGPIAG